MTIYLGSVICVMAFLTFIWLLWRAFGADRDAEAYGYALLAMLVWWFGVPAGLIVTTL